MKSSVRDTINSALNLTKGTMDCDRCTFSEGEDYCDVCLDEQNKHWSFIRVFDPEHVALMENVIDAIRSFYWDEEVEALDTAMVRWENGIQEATNTLLAYRELKGL